MNEYLNIGHGGFSPLTGSYVFHYHIVVLWSITFYTLSRNHSSNVLLVTVSVQRNIEHFTSSFSQIRQALLYVNNDGCCYFLEEIPNYKKYQSCVLCHSWCSGLSKCCWNLSNSCSCKHQAYYHWLYNNNNNNNKKKKINNNIGSSNVKCFASPSAP